MGNSLAFALRQLEEIEFNTYHEPTGAGGLGTFRGEVCGLRPGVIPGISRAPSDGLPNFFLPAPRVINLLLVGLREVAVECVAWKIAVSNAFTLTFTIGEKPQSDRRPNGWKICKHIGRSRAYISTEAKR
jgi:hypothetical protein